MRMHMHIYMYMYMYMYGIDTWALWQWLKPFNQPQNSYLIYTVLQKAKRLATQPYGISKHALLPTKIDIPTTNTHLNCSADVQLWLSHWNILQMEVARPSAISDRVNFTIISKTRDSWMMTSYI